MLHLLDPVRIAEADRQRVSGEFLLKIGDGKESTFPDVKEDYIQVPSDMLHPGQQQQGLIDWVFQDMLFHCNGPAYFAQRVIMTLKNSDADVMNDTVLGQFPGEASFLPILLLFAVVL